MKLFKWLNKKNKKNQKGQVLVIMALTLTMLIAVIGLAIDMGYMYVSYARLRRAVDAAALAGSSEFKRNYTADKLQGAVRQVLALNGYPIDPSVLPADTCDTVAAAANLLPVKAHLAELTKLEQDNYPNNPGWVVCTDPLKKLVRVSLSQKVPTFFLSIIGRPDFTISVTSISEAATVDVALLIDTSDSMTYGWHNEKFGQDKDPNWCNADDPHGGVDGIPGSCIPFQDVKRAAANFLGSLYFPYDRVSVITLDEYAVMHLPLSDDGDKIKDTILNLTVFDAQECPYTQASAHYNTGNRADGIAYAADSGFVPCRLFNNPTEHMYQYMDCASFYGPNPDGTHCMNTNIADGVALGGSILTGDYSSVVSYYPVPTGGWPVKRDEALWVMLLLTDGAANTATTNGSALCPGPENNYPWAVAGAHQLCRDNDTLTRHCWDYLPQSFECRNANYPVGTINVVDQTYYDGDDRARDMFDIISENNTLIFTIGMGASVKSADNPRVDKNGIPPGQTLLQYGAFGTYNDQHNETALKGLYYYGEDPAGLNRIFLAIANNLATRINQ